MDTIALFGGSFDPPHIGHEAVVKALSKLKYIEKIIIMPAFLNLFKDKFYAPCSLRIKWLREIFSGYKNVEICEFEANLQRQVPTIESVKYLLTKYKNIYLVIGADNVASLPLWHRYEELKKSVTFIVASRDEIEIPKEYIKLEVKEDISSSSLRKHIEIGKLPKKCADEIYRFYEEKNCKTE